VSYVVDKKSIILSSHYIVTYTLAHAIMPHTIGHNIIAIFNILCPSLQCTNSMKRCATLRRKFLPSPTASLGISTSYSLLISWWSTTGSFSFGLSMAPPEKHDRVGHQRSSMSGMSNMRAGVVRGTLQKEVCRFER
jgi:hypothetical protein